MQAKRVRSVCPHTSTVGRFRNAEINDLGDKLAVFFSNQNVGRFEVTMNETFLMRVLDRFA